MTTETRPLCIDGTQAHRFIIESPSGPYSHGVCQRCGLGHDFPSFDAEAVAWPQSIRDNGQQAAKKSNAIKNHQRFHLDGSIERRRG
jgi:hypothetical protein